MLLVHVLLGLAALVLGVAVVSQLLAAAVSLLPAPEAVPSDDRLRRFRMVIHATGTSPRLVESARRALRQGYPTERFEVVVVAVSLTKETSIALRRSGIQSVVSGFGDSLLEASMLPTLLGLSAKPVDALVLLRPGDELAPDYLLEANRFLGAGFRALQTNAAPLPTARGDEAGVLAAVCASQASAVAPHALGRSAQVRSSGTVIATELVRELATCRDAAACALPLGLRLAVAGEPVAYAARARIVSPSAVNPSRYRTSVRQLRDHGAALQLSPSLGRGLGVLYALTQVLLPPQGLRALALLALATGSLVIATSWAAVFAGLFLLHVATVALALDHPVRWATAVWQQLTSPTARLGRRARDWSVHPAQGLQAEHRADLIRK